MSDDIESRHFNPDDYQASAGMRGKKPNPNIDQFALDRLIEFNKREFKCEGQRQASLQLLIIDSIKAWNTGPSSLRDAVDRLRLENINFGIEPLADLDMGYKRAIDDVLSLIGQEG